MGRGRKSETLPGQRLGELPIGAAAGMQGGGTRRAGGGRQAAVNPGPFQGLGRAAGGGADTDPLEQ